MGYLNNMRRYKTTAAIFALFMLFAVQACKKSRSDIGKVFFDETKNRIFKKVEAETFAQVFKQTLEEKRGSLRNPKLISAFYETNDYDPVLMMKHMPEENVKAFAERLGKAEEHGLAPEMFDAAHISSLVNKVYDKKAIKSVDEAYRTIAELELATANSLIDYSNALQYGIISPRRIYARYFTETKRPDSVSMSQVWKVDDLKTFLDSIQPKAEGYQTLQKALVSGVTAPGMTAEETKRILQVNLERLRWKNREDAKKMVVVNIPDFRLDVLENGKSVLNMKVCVGEGREVDPTQLREYDENDLKKDRPFSRETPQLASLIHSVQVNPVWNIPKSIATNEISKHAAADPYYLANQGIDVYQNGERIEDPELIDWSDPEAGTKYSFKQRPGDANALGKIKFLFKNGSSVYLHDTPAKAAFSLANRAVSHGCVRVEKPLELAKALFGNGAKYETIAREMQNEGNPEAKDIALPEKVPVHLTYKTAWADEGGKVQFRKDVYGLDVVLYSYLSKMQEKRKA